MHAREPLSYHPVLRQAIASILEHKASGGKLADLVLSGVTISAKPADASTSDFLTALSTDVKQSRLKHGSSSPSAALQLCSSAALQLD